MQDFGQTPIALGRFTDDGGIIAVVGGAAFLFGFAINPLLGAAVALTVSNDMAAASRQKRTARKQIEDDKRELYGLPDANDEDAIARELANLTSSAKGERSAAKTSAQEKFTPVHSEVHPISAALKFTGDGANDSTDDEPVDGWTERPWTPPAPDLSLLPITVFKQKVEGGSINVERLEDEQIREYATGRCWQYLKRFKHHDNLEYLVWFVFGLHKGKAQWYQLAADFCDCCREHWLSARHDSPINW